MQLALKAIAAGDATVLADARRIGQYSPGEAVGDAAELAGRLFHTVYMGTVNSSAETRNRWEEKECVVRGRSEGGQGWRGGLQAQCVGGC
jgi:NAD+ synthase (glutamine-hydrolysing)